MFALSGQFPTFHQTLFCSLSTKFHELEQFLSRASYCSERAKRPLFLLVGFEQLPLGRQLRVKEQIDLLLGRNAELNLVIMYHASAEDRAHVIEELKNARFCPVLEDEQLQALYRSTNQHVCLVTSRLAGLGKSQTIANRITDGHSKVLRVPFYG